VSSLPLVATMTFDTNGHTMMGVSPEAAVNALSKLGLVALGGNCGNGPQEIEKVIDLMTRINPESIYVAKSNAGLPRWIDDELVYDGTPEVMAAYAVQVRNLGARLIGACCGSTPDHVRAMARALADTEAVLVQTEATAIAANGEQPPYRKSRRSRRFQRG